jgi:hypothetical protein
MRNEPHGAAELHGAADHVLALLALRPLTVGVSAQSSYRERKWLRAHPNQSQQLNAHT